MANTLQLDDTLAAPRGVTQKRFVTPPKSKLS
jgi:hypothetical protein